MHLEHVNLTVSDLDRSIDFYSALFGFRIRWRGRTSGGSPAAHVGDDRQYIALFEASRPGELEERDYISVGFNHFGIVVDDLDAMKSRLASLGVVVHGEADYEPGRRFYFCDPDGFEIEFVEYQTAEKELNPKPLAATA